MRRRFFVEKFHPNNTAELRGEAAEHLGRVLRAEAGQLYELSDGQSVWLARVENVALTKRGDSRVEFALVEALPAREPSLQIQLLISLVKFDRFEWCLEKATELGATEIIPMAGARSDKALVAAAGKRHTRWERILLESAQQARRLRPPVICEAIDSQKAFGAADAPLKILLSEREDASPMLDSLTNALSAISGALTVATLAVGPEGGWTDAEIAAARAAGFVEASLGENILRAETAVIAALSLVRFVIGD
ncbi:MAG TPA: RsmE family RNA methyltransferase [Candidatus Acidoferrales bacterium]|nr:RsmE family RNA methyltransferase [Candidatus Acidoferrales bacterium]